MKVLLAEDTRDLNRGITYLLEHEEYKVDSAYDGAEALAFLKENGYDCIILDIMMPRVDGITVLRELRTRHIITPVLLLTAKSEVADKISGLDAGADDYLAKPFDAKELMARIRALTRRRTSETEESYHFGDVSINCGNFEMTSSSTVRLSNKELELMLFLMTNRDIGLSTDFLLQHVWRNEKDAQGDTVWLYISYLKRKLSVIHSSTIITGERGGSFQLKTSFGGTGCVF
ncbi:MAG: response regulator transcription factor [Lachnospiraceae bacterium]|nr:response regulator transcription factor [Lachnospiraceae bacterium]